jgi:hypothetical protein
MNLNLIFYNFFNMRTSHMFMKISSNFYKFINLINFFNLEYEATLHF